MTEKSHIESLGKQTGSKGCTKSQECYEIKAPCIIKPLKKIIEDVFFKHKHTKEINLYLRKVILLYNCYTMELFWN